MDKLILSIDYKRLRSTVFEDFKRVRVYEKTAQFFEGEGRVTVETANRFHELEFNSVASAVKYAVLSSC